jgi:3-oxoadipate enol-lactonase
MLLRCVTRSSFAHDPEAARPGDARVTAVALAHEVGSPPTPLGRTPLVLAGALGTTRAIWDPQWVALTRRFHTVRYDARGHGASPVPPGPYSIAALAGDAIALLDRLGLDRVAWCGLSIGGMVGMWLAAHAPERIGPLVLCCTSARLGAPESYAERAAAVRTAGDAGVVADAVLERWLTGDVAAGEPAARLREMLAGTPPEGYAATCDALAAMDLRDDLGLIQTPTLIISGAADAATPPADARLLADRIDGARLEVVPGVGHVGSV